MPSGDPCRGEQNIGAMVAALERGVSPQLLFNGWFPDYPAASNLIQLTLACAAHSNYGDFCDRGLTTKMNRALELQQRDPAGAARLWAELDRALTDKATWIPLYNPYGTDFVSKRVGNYQYNPQLGALLSQIWVR